jgi:hypothetical protein
MADAMELSKQVYDMCWNREIPAEELKTLLEEHPQVKVNLYRGYRDEQALHQASERGHAACVRMLLQHGADVHAKDRYGKTPIIRSPMLDSMECVQLLIEANADVNAADDDGYTATHTASGHGRLECLQLLIDNGADVNARTMYGNTPAIGACVGIHLSCLQLLVDNKADLNLRGHDNTDALYCAILRGISFSVLCCNTDAKNLKIDDEEEHDEDDDDDDLVTEAKVAACIEEYKCVQAYIDDYHDNLNDTLSTKVEVDLRFGLGEHGIYQEPLERVLEYMGLSMKKDQVVNASIDGTERKRALIPFHVLNAKHWYNRSYKRRRQHDLQRKIEANEREIEAITLPLRRENEAYQVEIAALNAE